MDEDEEGGFESDGEYDVTFEDLQRYIEELEANPEATTSAIDSGEGPEAEEEREEWGYGDPDSVQAIDEEGAHEEEDDHVGPEVPVSQAEYDAFDLHGFAEL